MFDGKPRVLILSVRVIQNMTHFRQVRHTQFKEITGNCSPTPEIPALWSSHFRKMRSMQLRSKSVWQLEWSMLLEDPPMPSLAFFYPMKDLMDKLRRETGLDLCVDAREFANCNDPWPYVERGSGRSMYDLK